MAQLVGTRCYKIIGGFSNQRKSTIFPPPGSPSRPKGDPARVKDDEVNICLDIKDFFNLIQYFSSHVVVIFIIVYTGVLPVDAMYPRLALGIGFKVECSVAVAMRLHLLGIGLNRSSEIA